MFIENILYEIFDNAIKFSKPGTPVQIEVTQANQEVIFNVANENGYVTIEQLYEYELFQQFNREEQEQQGLGVGLAIIKLITHYVDAKLNFEKDLNTINVKINLNSYDE